jgi:hypothetical protein
VERIRIFDATELEMRVVHKPVVSLGTDDGNDPPAYAAGEPPLEHEDLEPVTVGSGSSDEQHMDDGQSFSEEPLIRNGVRFSSLFKSDNF